MIFRKIELDDIPAVRPYLEKIRTRIMDTTLGEILMWRDYMNIHYAIENDILFFKARYTDQQLSYFVPIGKDRDEGIKRLIAHCRENGEKLRLISVSDEELEWLKNGYDIKETAENTIDADYFYSAQDLRQFAGRKYHTQKNHINKFINTHTDYSFEEINEKNISEVISFYREYTLNYEKDSAFAMIEGAGVFEVLENLEKYGYFGMLLRAEGKVIAFSLGETVNDTMFVHIEKADKSIPGAYQMIVREFANRYTDDKVIYINRGDDAGDEGLRQSKHSYHPIALLRKNIVELEI